MLSLHLSLCEILVEAFYTTLRYCNTTRTNELKYATHLVQTGKHIHYILGDTSFLHYRVGRVHLYEVCIVSAHNARNLLVTHQFVTGAATCDSEDISVGGTDNVDVSVFDVFDYLLNTRQNGNTTIVGNRAKEKIKIHGLLTVTGAEKTVCHSQLVEISQHGKVIFSQQMGVGHTTTSFAVDLLATIIHTFL